MSSPNTSHSNSNSSPGLRKPVFIKVDQLRPGTSGHNLIVKVISAKLVLQKGRPDASVRQMRIAECMIGDDTGIIIFTARNDQGINLQWSRHYVLTPSVTAPCWTPQPCPFSSASQGFVYLLGLGFAEMADDLQIFDSDSALPDALLTMVKNCDFFCK